MNLTRYFAKIATKKRDRATNRKSQPTTPPKNLVTKSSGFSGLSRCYSSSGDALRRVPTKAATRQPATNALTMNSERMVIQNPKRAMQPQVSAVSAKQVAERIVGNDCGRN